MFSNLTSYFALICVVVLGSKKPRVKGAFLFLQQFELCEVRVLFTTVVNGQHSVCLCDGGDDVPGTLVGVWA